MFFLLSFLSIFTTKKKSFFPTVFRGFPRSSLDEMMFFQGYFTVSINETMKFFQAISYILLLFNMFNLVVKLYLSKIMFRFTILWRYFPEGYLKRVEYFECYFDYDIDYSVHCFG